MRAIGIIKRLISDQRGATAVEYGLIVAMIVLAMLGALQVVATANSDMWTRVSNAFSAVVAS